MSYGNSGDFDRGSRSAGQGPANTNMGGPFGTGPNQPPPRKSKTLWWVLGILGFLTVGGALVCCGGGYFMFRFSTQIVADAVKESIANDVAIKEHIGTISGIAVNLTATGSAGGGEKLVFDISGDKGSGMLEVAMDNGQNGQVVKSCVLVLPNGDRHDVVVTMPVEEATSEVTPEEVPAKTDAAEIESDLLNPQETEPVPN